MTPRLRVILISPNHKPRRKDLGFHCFLIQMENGKMLKDSFPPPLNQTPHHNKKHQPPASLWLENLFREVFLNALASEKEIPENMYDLWAGGTRLRPPHYEQQENSCQKSARALILITLRPPCVQGYESDSLSPLHCTNSSRRYNLFLIQHNKRMSLKQTQHTPQQWLTTLRSKSQAGAHLECLPWVHLPCHGRGPKTTAHCWLGPPRTVPFFHQAGHVPSPSGDLGTERAGRPAHLGIA